MLAALARSGKATLGKLVTTVYNLPGEYEILQPLKVILLESIDKISELTYEQRLETLTPSQRTTHNFVLKGYRNKEIAAEMGNSYNTTIHHVAAMLAKMGCGDRLQLMATAQGLGMPRKVLPVPDMVAVKPMPNLPISAKLQRQTPALSKGDPFRNMPQKA